MGKNYLVEKVNVVESIRGGMSDSSRSTLLKVLENSKSALECNKQFKFESYDPSASTQLGNIDWFPQNMINMVSAIYASQIIEDIVSVQAIDSPIGVIRFLQYTYGTDRGSALKNSVMIDEWGAMRGVSEGKHVAAPRISGEVVTVGASNTIDTSLTQLPVILDDENDVDLLSNDGTKHLRVKRTNGVLKLVKLVNGAEQDITPSSDDDLKLDPSSGALHIKHTELGTQDSVWSVDYTQDLSFVPSDTMNVELKLRTEMVKALPHKIRANFSFDSGYAFSKTHGIDAQESLINACTAEIRQERDNEVIKILMAQAGTNSSWDRHVTSYISQRDHDESFLSELFSCASMINFKTKRAFGNWAVVGRQGLNILNSVGGERFKPTGTASQNNGAFVAGELDGRMKIIYSPYMPENKYLVGYKGNDMDAGFIVADYLPLAKTDMVMLDDFIGRQGMISYYGVKMVNRDMYVVGTIQNGW